MAGSRPTAWVGQFPLAWERERVVVSFRVLPNVRHVKGNFMCNLYGAACVHPIQTAHTNPELHDFNTPNLGTATIDLLYLVHVKLQ